ncbi:MAG: OmpA family protein [Bacteroidota bacterium]|nr:OmpA family protein [Bacteroidota bacterium]
MRSRIKWQQIKFLLVLLAMAACQAIYLPVASMNSPVVQLTPLAAVERFTTLRGVVYSRHDSTTVIASTDLIFMSRGQNIAAPAGRINTRGNGDYQFKILANHRYQAVLKREQLSCDTLLIDVPIVPTDTLIRNLYFNCIDSGYVDDFGSRAIYFDNNRAELRSESAGQLNEFRQGFLAADSDSIAIIIEGHAEPAEVPVGYAKREQYLMGIGWERAKAACSYLIKNGVPSNRLFVVSYGAQRPAAPNTTSAYRQLNRRAELKFSLFSDISKYRSGRFAPNLFGGRVFPCGQSTSPVKMSNAGKSASTIRH